MPYRIVSPERRRAYYTLLIAGAVAGFVALVLVLGQRLSATQQTTVNLQSQTQVVCVRVQKLQGVIVAVLEQTLRTFGQRGTPGYLYYRAHPAELIAGRMSLEHEITEFRSQRCR